LQGPIDDVFYEPFLVVAPSGTSPHPHVEAWVRAELAHFQDRWRRLFRGDLRLKLDRDVTADDLQKYSLILWGDPASNELIGRALPQLPLQWNEASLTMGKQSFAAETHVPCLIYPNPLGRGYVVLNSGPTFRESHDRTNSQQTPKLPDWAAIDLSQPPDAVQPGRIAAAGFFDEQWQWRP
jgi:hypothetical protein